RIERHPGDLSAPFLQGVGPGQGECGFPEAERSLDARQKARLDLRGQIDETRPIDDATVPPGRRNLWRKKGKASCCTAVRFLVHLSRKHDGMMHGGGASSDPAQAAASPILPVR